MRVKLTWISICRQSDLLGKSLYSDLHIKLDKGKPLEKTHRRQSGTERYIKGVYLKYLKYNKKMSNFHLVLM